MRYQVVESKHYFNPATGATASLYGAHPHFGTGDGGWVIRSVGWTISDTDAGTVGCGRPPFQTKEEAQTLATKWELDHERRRGAHAFYQNTDAKYARAIEPADPASKTAFWDGWNAEFEASNR